MKTLSDKDFFDELTESSWLSSAEGQLSVDVIETHDEVIVRSAIAGIAPEDIDITLSNDTLTIRGTRHHGRKGAHNETTHVQECYWGGFSRSIVLPASVHPDKTDAVLKNGILTITMKKLEESSRIPIIDMSD